MSRGIGSNERRLLIKLSVRNRLKLQIINNEYHIPNLSQNFENLSIYMVQDKKK